MTRILSVLLVVSSLFALGCSDDTVSGDKNVVCEFGERRNPITNECVRVNMNNGLNNGTPVNNGMNNGEPVNNGVPMNNGVNNTTNNMTTPDMADMGATDMDSADMTSSDMNNRRDLPPLECGPGDILGKACEPSGGFLVAADVTLEGVDCDGNPFTLTTYTNQDGEFTFTDVPGGTHTLTIKSGQFETSRDVFVRKDNLTDLTASADKICLDATSVKIAVVGGKYDHVEGILGSLNLTYDLQGDDEAQYAAAQSFLTDPTAMGQYDIIFINCGELWTAFAGFFGIGNIQPQVAANLRAFVNAGGSLYASDWSAPFIEAAFPDVIDLVGVDTDIADHRVGFAPQTITADVLTSDLQAVLGGSMTATIEFPHDPANMIWNDHWTVAEAAGAMTTVHVQGDAQVCQNARCMNASNTPQLDAPLLATWKSPAGGTVIFTSFHNERQAALNQDMERILRYLVFQL